jgi:hypothetical protein
VSDLRRWEDLHPKTRKLISDVLEWHEQTNSGKACCLPRPNGDTWFLCSYHEGYDDALGEAEVDATDNKDKAIEATKVVRLEDEIVRLRAEIPAVQHVEADFDRLKAENKRLRAERSGEPYPVGTDEKYLRELRQEVESLTGMVSALRVENERLWSIVRNLYQLPHAQGCVGDGVAGESCTCFRAVLESTAALYLDRIKRHRKSNE